MHAISSYRSNRPKSKHTHPPPPTHTNPQTGPITIHCVAASLARSVNRKYPAVQYSSARAPVDRPRHAQVSRPGDDRQSDTQGRDGPGELVQVHKIRGRALRLLLRQ